MVEAHIDNLEQSARIVLTPNRSWSWRANLYILYSLTALSLAIATGFLLFGVWVILPFTLLELSFLLGCTYYVVKQCHAQEVITVSAHEILIERGYRKPAKTHNYHRVWTQFMVRAARHPWDAARVSIRSHGEELEIGKFLNKTDKLDLIDALRKVVRL